MRPVHAGPPPRTAGTAAGRRARGGHPFVGAFESTYLPGAGVDVAETTGHDRLWRADLDRLVTAGVSTVRYPLRWHRIEATRGRFDWAESDAILDRLREQQLHVVLDLVHHTSYPAWLDDGFRDRRFGPAFLRYAEAVAERYPWLQAYTLFNEPFATLFLAGSEALWPPYDRGVDGFVRLLRSVLPALSAAARCWSELLPDAEHVWVDTCEHHRGTSGGPERYAALANDRRHVVLDLALGHDLDPDRPFLRSVLEAGGESLLDLDPVRVDRLGLDYYCHSEWFYDDRGSHSPSPHPLGFAALAEQYGARYGLPMLLAETNLRGLPTDRATWLRHTLEQYELAVSRGVDLGGYCWFPYIDSCDWDSLLARGAGRVDPVGVVSLQPDGRRRATAFTRAWEAAAAGAPAASLPAYRFQPPCDEQLRGLLPHMDHWEWQEPPDDELVPAVHLADRDGTTKENAMTSAPAGFGPAAPDLVVLSHLRWPWVWQRPQHLVSRLAAARSAAGARTWFVEEPVTGPVPAPVLRTEQRDGITRAWLEVPEGETPIEHLDFGADGTGDYGVLLRELLCREQRPPRPDVWLYTPLALDLAEALTPGRLVYDVMDDLASFAAASAGLRLLQRRALAEADVVFTGGRSLHHGVLRQRPTGVHLFPSGVETAHYQRSRQLRPVRRDRPVAGYVGVVDERLDLGLIAAVAAALPDWTVSIVGPVAKIDPSWLPRAANLEYQGLVPYEQLPEVMAGFDVALMPFALNDATRSISPTKTLEYLAAGLPVVSTRVPDVVTDYDAVVHFADDGPAFADACRQVLRHAPDARDRRLRTLQARHEWDCIAASMADALAGVVGAAGSGTVDLTSATDVAVGAAG